MLDFDLCILRIHSCGCKLTPEQVMYRHPLETDFNDLLFFTGMVRALLAADVAVAIASFGKYDVIQTYMDRAFGIDAPLMPDGNPPPMVPGRLFTRDNISTPSVVGAKDGYTHPLRKNPQLAKLMAERGLTETQLMFFDGACRAAYYPLQRCMARAAMRVTVPYRLRSRARARPAPPSLPVTCLASPHHTSHLHSALPLLHCLPSILCR